ncbi:MAG TPA: CBS domain-containing protein [Candidatus Binataceae bacterium]|nr:CBS domain-containing protein [Candidatus Binataceae bacterium]
MQIVNWMTRNPVWVSPDDTLAKAKALMDQGRFRRLPVMAEGKLVGIVTERDLRSHHGFLDSIRVGTAMTSDPAAASPRDTVQEAAELILQHKIGGLPVVDNGKLVGVLTTTDLMRALLNVVQGIVHVMDD